MKIIKEETIGTGWRGFIEIKAAFYMKDPPKDKDARLKEMLLEYIERSEFER